jgi:cyclopropane-fatty-acyl-phospholipid synthase
LDDMGPYYARTLHVWRENFHRELAAVRAQGFDETFLRKWDYYLAYCEAAFATRHISVVQAIYTRADNETLDFSTDLNRGCS